MYFFLLFYFNSDRSVVKSGGGGDGSCDVIDGGRYDVGTDPTSWSR